MEESDAEPELMKICRGCGGRVPKSVLVPCPLCNGSRGFFLDGGIVEIPTTIKEAENKELKPQTTASSTNESEKLERLRKENTQLKMELKQSTTKPEEAQKIQDESSKSKKEGRKKSNKELAEEYNREHYPEEAQKIQDESSKSKKEGRKKSNKELAEDT